MVLISFSLIQQGFIHYLSPFKFRCVRPADGQGNAGRINITTTENISIEGTNTQGFSSGIFSTVDTNAVGDAGGINLNTANLTL